MIYAYAPIATSGPDRGLRRVPTGVDSDGGGISTDGAGPGVVLKTGPIPPEALWIDLLRPLESQIAALRTLGVDVPTLEDMEEIEISNRLYHEGDTDYMTVVLPGVSTGKTPISGPVTFILSPERLVTVRHHTPRPFETFPERAEKSLAGCGTPARIFLGLVEDIVSRLADLLEHTGRTLDDVTAGVFGGAPDARNPAALESALAAVGRQGELLGRIRLSLLTLERALSFFGQNIGAMEGKAEGLRPVLKGLMRDIQALSVHGDFLSQRVGLAADAVLGMVNLAQNATVRIVSVVAVLFLPPTLIASIYGMNFHSMPELDKAWGYPAAVGLMICSAVATYVFFRWKKWL